MKDIEWFKNQIAPTLVNYELQYRFYNEGDFGSLNQVIIESPQRGGGIDFWGSGWLGIDIFDYEKGESLQNILLEPHQIKEKEMACEKLLLLLNY